MIGISFAVEAFVVAAPETFSGTVSSSGEVLRLLSFWEAPDRTAERACPDMQAYAKHVLESIAYSLIVVPEETFGSSPRRCGEVPEIARWSD